MKKTHLSVGRELTDEERSYIFGGGWQYWSITYNHDGSHYWGWDWLEEDPPGWSEPIVFLRDRYYDNADDSSNGESGGSGGSQDEKFEEDIDSIKVDESDLATHDLTPHQDQIREMAKAEFLNIVQNAINYLSTLDPKSRIVFTDPITGKVTLAALVGDWLQALKVTDLFFHYGDNLGHNGQPATGQSDVAGRNLLWYYTQEGTGKIESIADSLVKLSITHMEQELRVHNPSGDLTKQRELIGGLIWHELAHSMLFTSPTGTKFVQSEESDIWRIGEYFAGQLNMPYDSFRGTFDDAYMPKLESPSTPDTPPSPTNPPSGPPGDNTSYDQIEP